ncbi:DUF4439 domain-containing protein [Corynebacterium sp. CCM 9204]|uniref:DUF4439 domain-containing protein n=1 Tax=Corynebacterium sp. CCM 9204 TaxID=3057616 RepID=UPI003524C017
MKHHPFLLRVSAPLSALLLTGGLTACQAIPTPEPDPVLTGLSASAHADATYLNDKDPSAAAVRARHAAALDAEIRRLCGFLEDGRVPASCTVPEQQDRISSRPGDGDSVLSESRALTITELAALPKESVLPVARMHAELAVITGSSADPSSAPDLVGAQFRTGSVDMDALRMALEWEYGAIFGLSVAQAWATPEAATLISEAVERHRSSAAQLRRLVADVPDDELPSPAAGYRPGTNLVTPADVDSALKTAVRIEVDSARMWQAAAATAEQPVWRTWCVLAGSTTVLRSLPLLAAAGTNPTAEGLFDLTHAQS